MGKKRVLILDDDKKICDLLAQGLAAEYEVITTQDTETAFRFATQNAPDLLLMDINLKEESGIKLCAELRKNPATKRVPILLFTGDGSTEKMLDAYDAGADDYIEKPVDLLVIRSRIKARIQRTEELSQTTNSVIGDFKLFPDIFEVEYKGQAKKLSQIEYDLLLLFAANLKKNVSREEILKTVWKNVQVSERTVDVHVSSLRKKIKSFNYSIKSLYGSGYVMRSESENKPD